MAQPATKNDYQDQEALDFYLNEDNTPEAICAFLAERQFDRTEQVNEPDDVTREILQLAQDDDEFDKDWFVLFKDAATEFHADAARRQPGIHAIDGEKWNDAELTGKGGSKWDELLDTVVHVTRGYHYTVPDKKKFNTRDDQWNGQAITWRMLIEGHPGKAAFSRKDRIPVHGLSRHPEDDIKSGAGTNFANCNTHRRAKSVTSFPSLSIDSDTGHFDFDEATEMASAIGCGFIANTTHSHLSTQTELVYDDVVRHAKTRDEPTLNQIKAYLRDKKNLADHIVDSIEVEEMRAETPNGWLIRLCHAPIPKYRLTFPFAEGDMPLRDLANSQAEALKVYASKVRGIAELVGIPTDPATTDASRFFYDPRHKKGSAHRTVIHRAPPISFADIPEVDATGNESTDAFAAGTKSNASTKRRPDVVTEDGTDVSALYDKYAKRWMLADICEAAGLETSAQVSNSGGKFHVRCPFADGHTNPGDDGATFVMNAEDSQSGFAVIDCRHGSCQSGGANGEKRHTVEYLAAWIDSGDLDPAMLEDPAFMLPLPDDWQGDKYMQPTPDEIEEGVGVGSANSGDSEFEDPDDYLPKRYVRGKDTIFLKQKNAEGDEVHVPVCGVIDVVGRSATLVGTGDSARIISFVNENGKRVELTIPRADIYGSPKDVWKQLADAGLPLAGRDKKAEDRMLDLLGEMTPQRLVPTLRVPGMVRDEDGQIVGFMPPTGEYIPRGSSVTRLHEDATVKDTCPKGTLHGWTDAASAALSYVEGNPYWTLEVVSAFAGPLLDVLDWNPVGFNFSGGTGKGKSMGQTLNAAAWANPADGKGTFWGANSTPNAYEDLAVFGSGTGINIDDLGAVQDKRILAPLLFALHSGRGKARKRGNGAGLTATAEFRPFVLFSNEHGMKAEVEAASMAYRGGMASRFPDVDVSDGKTRTQEERAKIEACKKNYGHAGPVFIQYLFDNGIADDPEKLEKEVLVIVKDLSKGTGLERAARPFALAQRAGELAVDAELLDDVAAVRRGVKMCWEIFLKSDEAATANGNESLLDGFLSWLHSQMDVTILPASKPAHEFGTAAPPSNSEGRGRVIGWYTDTQIILDWKALEAMNIPNTFGKRQALMTALQEIDALDRSGKSNIPYTSLPPEVGALPDGSSKKLKNVRMRRDKLGI